MVYPADSRCVGSWVGLRGAFADYLLNECNLSPATAWTYECGLRRLETYCGKPPEELTVFDVRKFLRDPNYSPGTKNSTLVSIKAFHRWGQVEGYWISNGIASLRGPRLVHNPQPSLTFDEICHILTKPRRSNGFRLVYLGLYAGLRVSESARIDESMWLGDRLRFVGKGRKVREVPVHPTLERVRDIILSNSPSADSLKTTCRAISHVARVPFTSHALRRTFGVTLHEAGVDRDVIGALLGHAPATVTVSSYVPVRWFEKTEAIKRLPY